MKTTLLIVLVLVAHAPRATAQVYSVGINGGYGTALVPPTSSGVLTTGLTVREVAGIVGSVIVFLSEIPLVRTTEVTYESDGAGNVYEVRTTYAVSDEAQASLDDWMETRGRALLRGEAGQEVELDIALRQLGGDTSGIMVKMWRPLPFLKDPLERIGGGLWIAQLYVGRFRFHEVTSRHVTAENGTLSSAERTGEQDFTMVGTAVRAHKVIADRVRLQFQLDLNAFSIIHGYPSPMRFGIETVLPHTLLRLEVVTSGLVPHGLSINAGATFAL